MRSISVIVSQFHRILDMCLYMLICFTHAYYSQIVLFTVFFCICVIFKKHLNSVRFALIGPGSLVLLPARGAGNGLRQPCRPSRSLTCSRCWKLLEARLPPSPLKLLCNELLQSCQHMTLACQFGSFLIAFQEHVACQAHFA